MVISLISNVLNNGWHFKFAVGKRSISFLP